MSTPHSLYKGDSHVLLDVTVTDIKEGCALGIVVEQLDDDGSPIATESVGTYRHAKSHRCFTAVRGTTLRIKWLLTGDRPSSTFEVQIQGLSQSAVSEGGDLENSMDPAELAAIDIGTLGGLRTYLGSLTEDPQARA
jgi:hypothetical protein